MPKPLLGLREQIQRLEPDRQRQLRRLENHARGDRGLVIAAVVKCH